MLTLLSQDFLSFHQFSCSILFYIYMFSSMTLCRAGFRRRNISNGLYVDTVVPGFFKFSSVFMFYSFLYLYVFQYDTLSRRIPTKKTRLETMWVEGLSRWANKFEDFETKKRYFNLLQVGRFQNQETYFNLLSCMLTFNQPYLQC